MRAWCCNRNEVSLVADDLGLGGPWSIALCSIAATQQSFVHSSWRTIALRSVAATVQSLRVALRRSPTLANDIARVSPSWRSPCWTLRSSRSFFADCPTYRCGHFNPAGAFLLTSLTFSQSDSVALQSLTVLENFSLHLRNSLAILR